MMESMVCHGNGQAAVGNIILRPQQVLRLGYGCGGGKIVVVVVMVGNGGQGKTPADG